MCTSRYDLCVIGGGSGGFAAAWAGARLGLRTLLVEKADVLGGNAVRGGVNNWEMGVGGTGIPFDLYRLLRAEHRAIGIYTFARHGCWHKPDTEPYPFPGGECVIDPRQPRTSHDAAIARCITCIGRITVLQCVPPVCWSTA